ncbi:hypothetical protein TrCOL_g6848 [Triparma columacea]|uniref:Diacylglycerol kinase n=1 Tax=Triparma columacea TaxID=722753 RepID=A0A9W7GA33_9STRA|nr:hypothetical protein TrCOL_g6848 [Triparma columacea]
MADGNYLDDDELDADMDIGSFRRRSVFSQSLSSSSVGPRSPLEQVLETKTAPRSNTSYIDSRVSEEDDIEMKGEVKGSVVSPVEEANTFTRNAGKWTVVAFLNSGSGGGMGKKILIDMVELLGEEYVFDLRSCKKGNMPEDKLLPMAKDPLVRVLACGGDGTMGWILSSIDKVWKTVLGDKVQLEDTKYRGHLPLAMMPLGTGNDLSRSFHWGGTFSNSMRKAGMIKKVEQALPVPLDRWRCVVVPFNSLSEQAKDWVPAMLGEKMRDREASIHHLKTVFNEDGSDVIDVSLADDDAPANDDDSIAASDRVSVAGEMAETQSFDGVFCNYFSIGLDARVAFSFHKEREEHPERFKTAVGNKLKYIQKGMSVGGLCGVTAAQLPPVLNGKVKVLVEDPDDTEDDDGKGGKKALKELEMPKNCRGVALLNIQSYGGGNKFTNEGSYQDGLIEVIFFTHPAGMAACAGLGPAMPFLRFKVRACTSRVCIKMSQPFHCQVDGEPWLQSEGLFQISYHGRSPVLLNKTSCCM